ncbi:MAG: type transport system ATP-binding protein [Actinomycetota bacterium]|jgi:ABC-2 type transport system ATP-binding protein|nr:type transport system ATP-binding protein [Actinomycetota bacterium]
MTAPAIEVKALRKSYGDFEAVQGVDLTVQSGEVFALLGPNGAGKTTTVEIMEGHRQRSSGEVSVLGFDPGKRERGLKEKIGIVLQETGVNRFLTVAEVIEQFRGYYPHPRPLDEIIDVVELTEKRDELVRKLSGGQQRRLDVAVGLAGDPDLLFLDEPTTGFDPSARRNAWQMIKNLNALGKTVFLTTHYMDEAQFLADRVAIIVGGKIVAEGTPASLAEGMAVDPRSTYSVANEQAPQLMQLAQDNGIELREVAAGKPSLEDVYLELTKDAEKKVEG